jgi:hypothetical protein
MARREGYSLRTAARMARTDSRTVLRHVGGAFRLVDDRYVPTEFDRIPREMNVLTVAGPVAGVVRDSRIASELAYHANAVGRYLATGDEEGLQPYRGRHVLIGRRRYELAADPVLLDRLAAGGEITYELYRT